MKFMTKLETIIMNRTGCNRETANLVANDILDEADSEIRTETIDEFLDRACTELQTGNLIMDKSIADILYYVANEMKGELTNDGTENA
jgi:hypothetical protein